MMISSSLQNMTKQNSYFALYLSRFENRFYFSHAKNKANLEISVKHPKALKPQ